MNSNKFIIEYNGSHLNMELRNVYYRDKSIGYIYLYVNNVKEGMYLFYQLRIIFKHKSIEIRDIPNDPSEKYKNKGIGSRALKIVDNIAIKLKTKYIFGGISRFDYDHYDRLVYFYQKNGFEILYDSKDLPCGIRKDIKKLIY